MTPPSFPQMRTEWLTTTNVSISLVALITLLLVIFVGFALLKMWSDWSSQSRCLGLGGIVVLLALGLLAANEFADETFRSHFLSDFIVAISVLVVSFFAIDQYLETQKNRSASAHYLPAIVQELLHNARHLSRTLALLRNITQEGYEHTIRIGVPNFQALSASWSSLLYSGHFVTLPTQRGDRFKQPLGLLCGLHDEFVASSYFAISDSPDYTKVISWADDFPTDLERVYELLRDVGAMFAEIDLKAISSRQIGIASTPIALRPENEEQRQFVAAHGLAVTFCEYGTLVLEFCCFVLCEVIAHLKDDYSKSARDRYDFSTIDKTVSQILISVPLKLLKRSQPLRM